MLLSAWLFVGVLGILATAVAVTTQTQMAAGMPNDDGIAIMSGVVGFLSWGVWTFGTLEIEAPIQGSPDLVFSHPELTMLGIVWMLVPGYIALTGPVEIIRRSVSNPEHREV